MERTDLFEHPNLQSDDSRADYADLIDTVMVPWCRERTNKKALSELNKARISCAPVYKLKDAMAVNQMGKDLVINKMFYDSATEQVPYINTPVSLSKSPGKIKTAAPVLGADTDAIMGELGYSTNNIKHFYAEGVI